MTKSKCCHAKVKLVGSEDFGGDYGKEGTTFHYECSKCGKDCDITDVPYEKEYLREWRKIKRSSTMFTLPRPKHFLLAKQRFIDNAEHMGDKSFHKTPEELEREQDEEIADAINYEIFKNVRNREYDK